MVSLIDTNIIIRFLVGDHEEHLQIATDALICSKSSLQGYGKLSFDKDVNKKC